MKYNKLGNTGLIISELCMGTMTFGNNPWKLGGVTQNLADEMIRTCLDAGINFFDTANVYSYGESESMLGKALGSSRKDVVIATKVRGNMNPANKNAVGLSRVHIMNEVDASLKRLGTDYIDLYQVHGWDVFTPLEETLGTLDDLVHAGKIRYAGFCNYAAWQAALSFGISSSHHFTKFVSAQMYYSMICRDIEHEIVPLCQHQNLALLPWSPLAGGLLSGKYSKKNPPQKGTRFGDTGNYFPSQTVDHAFDVIDMLELIASKNALTLSQISLAWMLSKPFVTSMIIGARTIEQLRENIFSVNIKLPHDDLQKIDEFTSPKKMYPKWMIDFQSGERK